MVIGIVAVLVIAAIGAAFWLGSRSGDDKATTATTPTATQTTPTATTPTSSTVTSVQTVTQSQPQPGAGVEIVEQSINPTDATRNSPVVLTVRTRGNVTSVRMDINGREPKAVELVKGPTVNDITNWAASTTAPGLAGAYTYKAIVTAGDGSAKEGPASSFTVLP